MTQDTDFPPAIDLARFIVNRIPLETMIAIVGPTKHRTDWMMLQVHTELLRIAEAPPPEMRSVPRYEIRCGPARIRAFDALDIERLRGPLFHGFWLDTTGMISTAAYAAEELLEHATRLGDEPRPTFRTHLAR